MKTCPDLVTLRVPKKHGFLLSRHTNGWVLALGLCKAPAPTGQCLAPRGCRGAQIPLAAPSSGTMSTAELSVRVTALARRTKQEAGAQAECKGVGSGD